MRLNLTVAKHLIVGLLAIFAIAFGELYLEGTPFGYRLRMFAYEVLQGGTIRSNMEVPVGVLDISKVPGGKDSVTSRQLRTQYLLANEWATAEDFERALPALLDERGRQQMIEREQAERQSAVSKPDPCPFANRRQKDEMHNRERIGKSIY